MDRMAFIPGNEAKDKIFNAAGHIVFQRSTAIAYANEFLSKAPVPIAATAGTYQAMMACLSDGDQVDIYYGLCDPDASKGHEIFPSGEAVGHTWATLKTADGRETHLWEVGRATPSVGEAHAARAFNAYRDAMARFKGIASPEPVPLEADKAHIPCEFNGKPVISHALSPANLYYASSRMWYFVDLLPAGDDMTRPLHLSRPMTAFDALILSALVTLANGARPLVFGVANTMDTLDRMPGGYVRATYEADETLKRPAEPLVVL
ncbi:hypothetical protein QQS21_006679 [Conoideocrella luteorostrata]|uniref:Uncharacterized protein n=1 Tax=Conoideocrella luteorostrata TaxID=1105319 RepID=A0AAJ0FT84_9HYPO|nr:hypothetical protein QQS21_006679 [Conoideocrella luteorostrata]